MMARLMADTLERWVLLHGIDSFRFDLMGHQPKGRDAGHRAASARQGRAGGSRRWAKAGTLARWPTAAASTRPHADRAGRIGHRQLQRPPAMPCAAVAPRPRAGHGRAARLAHPVQPAGRRSPGRPSAKTQQETEPPAAWTPCAWTAWGSLRGLAVPSMARGAQARADELPHGGQVLAYADRPGEAVNYAEKPRQPHPVGPAAAQVAGRHALAQNCACRCFGPCHGAAQPGHLSSHAGGELLRSNRWTATATTRATASTAWTGTAPATASARPASAPGQRGQLARDGPPLADARLQVPPALVRQPLPGCRIGWPCGARCLLRLASREAVARQLQVPPAGELGAQVLAAVLRDDSGQPAALLVLNASSQAACPGLQKWAS